MMPPVLDASSISHALSAPCRLQSEVPIARTLAAFLLVLVCAWPPARAESPRYFAIRIRSKLVGYAKMVHRTAQSGAPVRESWTALKVSLLGTPRRIDIHSITTLDKQTKTPVHVLLTRSINGREARWEITIKGQRAVLTQRRAGDTDAARPTELDVPESVLVLAGNDFGQWDLVLARARATVRDGRAVVPVILPEAGRVTQIKLQEVGTQEVEQDSRQQAVFA